MIFLDSSYLKGLMDVNDSYHQMALGVRDFIEDFNERTVINTTVLVETLNWSVKTNTLANNIYDELKKENIIKIATFDDDFTKIKGFNVIS